jgi:copper(I)-binding protein
LPLDFAIPAGQTTLLAEHGTRLRLSDLQMPLELTRTYPLRLTFAKAGVLRADLSVDYQRFL